MVEKALTSLDDIDDLLSQLTEEELNELNGDFDPDNPYLPASDRCRPQTDKEPTGPYNRKKLIKFLEEQAKKEKDWDLKPFEHIIRGKEFKSKTEKKKGGLFGLDTDDGEGGDSHTEWDDILEHATEEELVDLAAVLGFYSIMNQEQYNNSIEGKAVSGDFRGVAKATPFKVLPVEPPNDTDVGESIEKLEAGDKGLTDLNLNNIKSISVERLEALCAAVKDNTVIEHLRLANTALTDRVAKALCDAIRGHKSLLSLNVESNFLSGESICNLLEAANEQPQHMTEIRMANQRCPTYGVRTEMRLADLVLANETLTTVGLSFDVPGARVKAHQHLQNNRDKHRESRVAKK